MIAVVLQRGYSPDVEKTNSRYYRIRIIEIGAIIHEEV